MQQYQTATISETCPQAAIIWRHAWLHGRKEDET
jgi:hypothetical protein